MPAESKSNLQVEIGHVLFIDIVGYSKLLVNEQHELQEQLNQLVRSTSQFRTAEAEGKLTRLPTGDGMALVFFTTPEAPVQCAIEISRALHSYPQLEVRMGIHSGPVSKTIDVNDRINIAGAGINIAQRVMSCGDGGHILLSKHVAEDLEQYTHWKSWLHNLGEIEVKHGVRVPLVNLCTDEVGNPALPKKLKQETQARAAAVSRRRRNFILLAGSTLAIGILAASFVLQRASPKKVDKSIAVLPFENLSAEKENAYFAGGIQDEILTNLAKIGDLKVVSRTSVARYAGSPQSVKEIAKALGVAVIVEGSVQRVGNHIRISAQLIDAINDDHIWAENYERDVADAFGVQRDVALDIAATLHAKLSPNERQRIEGRPTKSAEAYLVYLQALDNWARGQSLEDVENVARLYERAIQLDNSFALAFARLSYVQSTNYHETARPIMLEKARAAAQEALRLQPGLPEAHLALAYIYYWGEHDYGHALAELAIAEAGLPNEADVFDALGAVQRRQGKWIESTASLEKSASLTPRDPFRWGNIATNYYALRDFPAAAKACDRGINLDPSFWTNRGVRAFVEIEWKGDLTLLEKFVAEIPENFDPDGQVTFARLQLKRFQRKYDQALQVLEKSPREAFQGWFLPTLYPKPFLFAEAYRLMNDKDKARASFTEAQRICEGEVAENPLHASRHALLGQIYAGLGRTDDAIREGKRAVELLPETKDAFDGPLITLGLAEIYAKLGKVDAALPLLEHSLSTPRGVSVNVLKLDPTWDPLRSDPRFVQILANTSAPGSR